MAKKNKPRQKVKPVKNNWPKPKINLLVGMGVLLLSLGFILYESQQMQDQRSRAVAANDCTISDAEVSLTSEEQTMIELVNSFREQNGITKLQVDTSLNRAAAWMSNNMSITGKLDHVDSLGRSYLVRKVDCGQPENAGGDENIYTGTDASAQTAFNSWKNSTDGHKEAMLRATNIFVGTARVGNYWTLDLSPSRGSATITPAATTPGVSLVPSSVCLGGCLISPTITTPISSSPSQGVQPSVSVQPSSGVSAAPSLSPEVSVTVSPSGTPNTPPSQSKGLIGLLLAFIMLILQFFMHLFGR